MNYEKSINLALRHISIARECYMMEYGDEFDADYIAEEFNKVTTILERLRNCISRESEGENGDE